MALCAECARCDICGGADDVYHMDLPHIFVEARTLGDRALGILRDVEWCGWSDETGAHCPSCGNFKDEGHGYGCELAALLSEANG